MPCGRVRPARATPTKIYAPSPGAAPPSGAQSPPFRPGHPEGIFVTQGRLDRFYDSTRQDFCRTSTRPHSRVKMSFTQGTVFETHPCFCCCVNLKMKDRHLLEISKNVLEALTQAEAQRAFKQEAKPGASCEEGRGQWHLRRKAGPLAQRRSQQT